MRRCSTQFRAGSVHVSFAGNGDDGVGRVLPLVQNVHVKHLGHLNLISSFYIPAISCPLNILLILLVPLAGSTAFRARPRRWGSFKSLAFLQ